MLNDKFTELNHKYNAFDYYKEKLDENFLEFTLEELGLPTANELHKQTLKIVTPLTYWRLLHLFFLPPFYWHRHIVVFFDIF